MSDKVFLVHGWSVHSTLTYQALHLQLAKNGFDLVDINLGRYVSLANEVEIRDIAKALHNALKKKLGASGRSWTGRFHIITHSTGALVVKKWIAEHYTGAFAANKPLKNLVFLAGPHFGSRLAHHGKSMLAQARYRGDTGTEILTALELGSRFSWEINEAWLDKATWAGKGIRPYSLIGNRVKRDFFKSKIFPAAYEDGSDMVVRVPAGNLNFTRLQLVGGAKKAKVLGGISDVPFGALSDYTHSGAKSGIMNSITTSATKGNHLSLKLILRCLAVSNNADYAKVGAALARQTRQTHKNRAGYAQLDLRFRDETGAPITDYVFKLGYLKSGSRRPSKSIAHTHKNKVDENHFTVFVKMKELEPKVVYFIELDSHADSDLLGYRPSPLHIETAPGRIFEILREDQTTQLDVVLSREPNANLFVFHGADDPKLHLEWDRRGAVGKTAIAPE